MLVGVVFAAGRCNRDLRPSRVSRCSAFTLIDLTPSCYVKTFIITSDKTAYHSESYVLHTKVSSQIGLAIFDHASYHYERYL